MFGTSDSADRRRAWWRGVVETLRSMTRGVLAAGFRRPQEPPTEPVHREVHEPEPVEGAPALREQQHVNPSRTDEAHHHG